METVVGGGGSDSDTRVTFDSGQMINLILRGDGALVVDNRIMI